MSTPGRARRSGRALLSRSDSRSSSISSSASNEGRSWHPLEVDAKPSDAPAATRRSCCCCCRRLRLRLCVCTLLVIVALTLAAAAATTTVWRWLLPAVTIPASDPRLLYTGRWVVSHGSARADWPCASIRFRVRATAGAALALSWHGTRVRLNATVVATDAAVGAPPPPSSHSILLGWPLAIYGIELPPIRSALRFAEGGEYEVEVTKLNDPAPYNMGIGRFIDPSQLRFDGLVASGGGGVAVLASAPAARRIEFVGASDTSGYCVDGTTADDGWRFAFVGWARQNCYRATPALLGRTFSADVQVVALPASGLTQNAFAATPWVNGEHTMADHYERALLTSGGPSAWNFSSFVPQLVVLSLGGNDYNHQALDAPSNATFDARYAQLLERVFEAYASEPRLTVISVCGQGSPQERALDPDNNRCRPCPHVERASRAAAAARPAWRLHYIFVPCDGSVVTGVGDIGCDGHKSPVGMAKVAGFLAPRVAAIMRWDAPSNGTAP